jgi:hypothetical protein
MCNIYLKLSGYVALFGLVPSYAADCFAGRFLVIKNITKLLPIDIYQLPSITSRRP